MKPLNISGTWTIRLADVKWGNTREAAGWKRNQKSIRDISVERAEAMRAFSVR
jgi:hypothetical protein